MPRPKSTAVEVSTGALVHGVEGMRLQRNASCALLSGSGWGGGPRYEPRKPLFALRSVLAGHNRAAGEPERYPAAYAEQRVDAPGPVRHVAVATRWRHCC